MPPQFRENLVTILGGAGYIGAPLVRQLLQERFPVRVFDNFTYGDDGIRDLKHPDLEVIQGDMLDIKSLSKALMGSETVVLLAAVAGKRFENSERPFMRELNLLASSVALDAAIEHGAHRFLFASTDSVYGAQSGVMYETGMPDPVTLYARLKLRMEEQIIKAKKRSFHPTALRIATCYGYSPRMRFDLVANGMLRDAVLKKEMIVESPEDSRVFVHVEDVARAFVTCIKAHVNLVSGEVFNVGSSKDTLQLNHLANLIQSLVPEARTTVVEGPADLTAYALSSSKIEKILDFSPRWTLTSGLEQLKSVLAEGTLESPFDPKYSNF